MMNTTTAAKTNGKTIKLMNGCDWVTFEVVAGRGVVMSNSKGPTERMDMTEADRDYRIGLIKRGGWVEV